jgi:uncharacterized protein (TIGR02453 family)
MASTTASPAFTGFPPGCLGFLRALALHNSREWFNAHREVFVETLQRPMGRLVDAATLELARRKVPLRGQGEKSMFRMNRDIRFSKDKTPYKTNLGAVLSRDGTKGGLGLLYAHLGPAECFLAAGVYMPEPEVLKRIRARVVSKAKVFRALRTRLERAGLPLDAEGALKRLPRGFEAVEAPDLQAAVKLKNFIVRRDLTEASLSRGPALVDGMADLAEAALPLLEFCWAAAAGR